MGGETEIITMKFFEKSNQPHRVMIFPGLSDDTSKLQLATTWWTQFGLEPVVMRVGWKEDISAEKKLAELLELARKLASDGKLSVLGTSAGGSLAFNLFSRNQQLFATAVSVCGRLKAGDQKGWRSLDKRAESSQLFKQLVLMLNHDFISIDCKNRLMTVSAVADELVPADTSVFPGAKNIKIPAVEHGASIVLAVTVLAWPIIKFIKSNNNEPE